MCKWDFISCLATHAYVLCTNVCTHYMQICMHACMYIYLCIFTHIQNLQCFSLPVASSVISVISLQAFTPAVSELYNISVTCTINPDSTADQCVVIAMADDGETKAGEMHKILCVLISYV